MKTLNLNEMEIIDAGGCTADAVGFGIAALAMGFLLLSNPVGWIAIGAAYTTIAGYGAATVNLVGSGNCF